MAKDFSGDIILYSFIIVLCHFKCGDNKLCIIQTGDTVFRLEHTHTHTLHIHMFVYILYYSDKLNQNCNNTVI